jgi:ectoine hydroxylase-related dioxygenase (phytanoyl-CoA dioxygenase family)
MYKINEAFNEINDSQSLAFENHGYVVVRNFFNKNEVEQLRKACKLKKKGDTIGIDEFNNVTLNPKIIKNLKKIIKNKIIYPCLSLNRADDKPIHTNSQEANSRGFHVDSVPDDYNFDNDYGIINTGIYLSDHKNFSGGLKVRPFSIKTRLKKFENLNSKIKNIIKSLIKFDFKNFKNEINFFNSINLDTLPGDLIIWKARCHHSGHFRRLKFFRNLSLDPILENILPNFLFIKEPNSREVILTIYGDSQSKYLEPYIRFQIQKQRRREHYLNNEGIENKIDTINSADVEIRNDGYFFWKNKL